MADDLSVSRVAPPPEDGGGRRPSARGKRRAAAPKPAAEAETAPEPTPDVPERHLDLLV